jgi:trehalose-6-phosphatase
MPARLMTEKVVFVDVMFPSDDQEDALLPMDFDAVDRLDPLNTNVYVGNISPEWREADIQQHFASE